MAELRSRLSRAGDLVAEPSQHITPGRLRALWIASVILVVGGNLLYLLVASDWSWWMGGLLATPFIWLAVDRLSGTQAGGDSGDGAWGPP